MLKTLSIIILAIIALQLSNSTPALAKDSVSSCQANLKQKIESVINSSEFERSRWGILIQTLSKKQTLYAKEPQSYFIPASNAKLLTTAATLNQLGANFRFRTPIYGTGTIPNLTSLRLVGTGDPTLTTQNLQTLAKELKTLGVNRVLELILEDSKSRVINPSWEWEDVYGHWGTAVNKLILNQNSFTFTVSPQKPGQPLKLNWSDQIAMKPWQLDNQGITAAPGKPNTVEINGDLGRPTLRVRGSLATDAGADVWDLALLNPRDYFLQTFRGLLSEQGITVIKAKIVTTKSNTKAKPIAVIASPPLSEMLATTNQDSNNLFAEALAKALSSDPDQSLAIIEQNLTALGLNPDSYSLDDASGLSRKNLVSPQAFVDILQLMAKTPQYPTYKDSLAVASLRGTLKNRFQNTPVAGKLYGKSGFLTGVLSLSGYLEVPDYDTLVFSIILNQSTQKYSQAQAAIDKIVLSLMDLSKCDRPQSRT